jgi:hypothetical protein
MLSVALKDYDVVTWLTEVGLGYGQLHLLEYLISDTGDERRIWEVVCANPATRKLGLAFLVDRSIFRMPFRDAGSADMRFAKNLEPIMPNTSIINK